MAELATRWDQSSIDPETRRLAHEKAERLERDRRRVREDSMRGLVRRRVEAGDTREGSAGCTAAPPTKRRKNSAMKAVERVLEEFTAGVKEDKEEMKELEAKQDQKDEDLMRGIFELTEEIRESSERRSHDTYLERETRKDELVLILEALRRDGEI